MSRFTDRLERDLDQIADRASSSSTAWESILTQIDQRADEPDTEVIMLTPDENQLDTRKRSWLMVAAAVAAVALVGGLFLAVTQSDDDPATADQPEQTELDAGDEVSGTPIPLTGADVDPAGQDAFAIVESAFAAYNSGDMNTWGYWNDGEPDSADDYAYELASEGRLEVEQCTYRGFAEWRWGRGPASEPVEGYGFDCDAIYSDLFLRAAGIELEMTYSWVVAEDLQSAEGRSNDDVEVPRELLRDFRDWLASSHPDIESSITYDFPNIPTAESVPIAAEYIDEFVAESDVYPFTEPVPPGNYGGPLEQAP